MDFSLTTLYVLGSGTLVPDGFKRESLNPTQFGIFNSRYKAVTTANEAVKSPWIQFGQGRIEKVPGLTDKYSDKVSRGSLVEWYKTTGSPTNKNQITYAGFDGIDETKTLKAGCDQTYSLTIRARSLYLDVVSAYGLTRTVTVMTPCCEDCGDNCATIDPRWLAEQFAAKINAEPWLSKIVVATPVFECETPPDPETVVNVVVYCLNVCDNGDAASLSAVQAQYPNDVITLKERVGSISTYQLTRLAADPAPVAAVITLPVRLAVCATCPATYVLQPEFKRFIVERPLAGTENLTTAVARQTYANTIGTAYTATNPSTFLSGDGGTAKVLIHIPVASADPVALLADILTQVENSDALCNPPAGTSVAWTSCDTGFMVQRTLHLTITDDCASDLATIQAHYPGTTITLVTSANCNSQYAMVQTSDTIQEDCEFHVPPVFDDVQPYKGIEWEPVDPTLTGADCVAGVKIEGKMLDKYGNPCNPLSWPYEYDKLTFEVFAYKGAATSQDYLAYDRCDAIPITTTQKSTYISGSGDEIYELEKQYYSYQTTMKHIYWNTDYNGAFVRYSNPGTFYDTYVLKFKSPDLNTWSETSRQDESVIIAVPTGTGKPIEDFLVGYFGIEKFTAGVLGQSL